MNSKILIIEDEKNIAESLSIVLEAEGLVSKITAVGAEGLRLYKDYDLLVLDLMLPDMEGFEVLEKIRAVDQRFPVIIASARSDEDDIVRGLSMGADDYVTKPFGVKELVFRIKRALERRFLYETNFKSVPQENIGSKFFINFSTLVAMTNEGEKKLTSQEVNLLLFLLQNKGRIISRKELLEKTWGMSSDIETRTVDNFIVRFRKYFEENPKSPRHFITKRGIGYLYQK